VLALPIIKLTEMGKKLIEELPDFLVIGAGKSGTTSIDKYLHQHPEIFVPRKKEPNFFGYENISAKDLSGNPEELAHYRNSVTTIGEYLKIFEEALPHQKRGETSNTYLYHKNAPDRILHYIPEVKLIAILRQPAERLFSRYMHLARENRTPTKEFADCLDQKSVWWRRNDLINEGFYARHLQRYFELFPRENIKVYLYEDFQAQPLEIMREIYEWLGVDASFSPDVTLRYNESGLIRNAFLNKIYGQGGIVSRTLRSLFPSYYQNLRSNLALKKKMMDLRRKNLEKKDMDPAIRRALTLNVYAEDIRQLGKLLHRDLSHWLKV
jgi:hypothetical protein